STRTSRHGVVHDSTRSIGRPSSDAMLVATTFASMSPVTTTFSGAGGSAYVVAVAASNNASDAFIVGGLRIVAFRSTSDPVRDLVDECPRFGLAITARFDVAARERLERIARSVESREPDETQRAVVSRFDRELAGWPRREIRVPRGECGEVIVAVEVQLV